MKLVVDVIIWGATILAKGGAAAFFLKTAGFVALSVLSSKLFGPRLPSSVEALGSVSVMTRSSVEYRKRVYGQAIVSGPVIYNNIAGTSNEQVWYQIALSDGEVDDFVEFHLDGDVIPKADVAWTAGTAGADGTGTGYVSTAKYVKGSTNAVRILYYLGHANQVASTLMVTAWPGDITNDHRSRGISYVLVGIVYNEDTQELWDTDGIPQNIRAVQKGRKVYDPRLDSTVIIDPTTSPVTTGSGSHRYNDATTWEWSNNPALCIADYLNDVMGVDPAVSIDWPSIATTADDCDVLVPIPPATSPQTTEKRFTCNGVTSSGTSHKDNLDSLLSSCEGRLTYVSGVWRLRASVWVASTVDIDADDLAGPVQVQGSSTRANRSNRIRGVFVDPARGYEPVEFPLVSDSTYLTRDAGVILTSDLELPMTNTETMAQRIAFRVLEQLDNQIMVNLVLNARGAKVAVGDVVSLTLDKFGWSAKTFRCIEWHHDPEGTFKLVLREDTAARYTDPAALDYTTANTGGVTYPSTVTPAPSSLAATGVAGGIRLNWTNPASKTFDYIEIYESASSAWGSASLIASLFADTYTVPHDAGETYYYWVRAVKAPDVQSIRNPDSDTSTVTATSTSGADGTSSIVASVYIRAASPPSTPSVDDGSYNFTTQTLTPPTGWSVSPPASDGNPVYVSQGIFQITGTTGTDSTVTWTAPALLVSDGADGAAGSAGSDGLNSAIVFLYHKNTSSVTPPTSFSGTFTYTFATAALSGGTLNGWAQTAPAIAAGEYLWLAQAVASNTTATDSVPAAEFSTPTVIAIGGADGAAGSAGSDGLNSAIVFLYHKNTSSVTPPTSFSGTFTYTFATAALSGGTLNGWAQTAPAIAAGEYLWIRQAAAVSTSTTDSVPAAEFSTAVVIAGTGVDGADGADGPGVVLLPVQFVSQSIGTLPQTCVISFLRNGTVSIDGFADFNWYSAAPVTDIGDSYQIANVSNVSGTWDSAAAAVGTYVTMSSTRTWSVTRTAMEGSGSDFVGGAVFRITPVSVPSQILASTTASAEAADA